MPQTFRREISTCTVSLVALFLAGCGLTSYRDDRDVLLNELRKTEIRPYYAEVNKSVALPPAPTELEEMVHQDGLKLEEAIAFALARNPDLVSALSSWQMLLERVPQVSSFDDPTLEYIEYLRSIQTRAGPVERGIRLSQKVPWPGKLTLKGEMALEDARRAEQEYRGTVLKVIEEVEHAYVDLVRIYQLIEINEDLKGLLRQFEQVARTKLEAGQATQQDVLRAQIQSIHLEHHGIVLERDRKIALEKLNAVLNRPSRKPVGTPQPFPKPEFEWDLDALIAEAGQRSPELRAREHAISKALASKSLASLEYLPDLTLGANYTQVDGGTNPTFSKDGEDAFALTFGINVPIQFGRRTAVLSEARGAIRLARAEYLRTKRDLEKEVTIAYERLVEFQHEALLLQDTLLPQTQQHLRAAQTAYEGGELDFLSLLDAEQNIEGIRQDYVQVAAEFQKALGTLRRATGGNLR